MAPKICELYVALHEKIINLHDSRLSYQEIGKRLKFSSVRYLIKMKKEDWYDKKISCKLGFQES